MIKKILLTFLAVFIAMTVFAIISTVERKADMEIAKVAVNQVDEDLDGETYSMLHFYHNMRPLFNITSIVIYILCLSWIVFIWKPLILEKIKLKSNSNNSP